MFGYNKEDINWTKNEIRCRKDTFLFCLIALICMEILVLYDTVFGERTLFIFSVFFVPGLIVLNILGFCNKKMLYDENGITFINEFKRKVSYSWDKVVSVEDSLEDPRVAVAPPGNVMNSRILKIGVIESNGKISYMKYFFVNNTGIPRFLIYYFSEHKEKAESQGKQRIVDWSLDN